jgi:hypothetical protein
MILIYSISYKEAIVSARFFGWSVDIDFMKPSILVLPLIDTYVNAVWAKSQEQRRATNEAPVDPKILQKYAIGDDNEIEKALQNTKVSASGIISVKSNKINADKKEKHKESGKLKRKGADGGRPESKKKRS